MSTTIGLFLAMAASQVFTCNATFVVFKHFCNLNLYIYLNLRDGPIHEIQLFELFLVQKHLRQGAHISFLLSEGLNLRSLHHHQESMVQCK